MKATDSRECRNCHTIEAMDLEAQESAAAKKHNKERMLSRGETCIDCHKGIGHGLPPGYE
jgi:nitrate/TMAO reductase-like tetraheme cytochrome c subunit